MKIKLSHISIETVIVFLVVLFNNETLANNYCQFMDQPVRVVAVIVSVFGLYRLLRGRTSVSRNAFVVLVFLTLFVVVAAVNDIVYTNGYFLTWMALLSGFFISISIDYQTFSHAYINVITFFSVFSLICTYVVQFATPGLLSLFGTITNSADVSFHNLIFCYIIKSHTYYRNLGIFREPGVYAIFLCFAIAPLLSNLQREKDVKTRKKLTAQLVILSVTVFTTFSTTGYIAYVLLLAFHFMFHNKETNQNGKTHKRRKYGGIVLFMVAVFALFLFAADSDTILNPFSKLSYGTKEYSSYLYRMETISNGLKLIVNRPFGHGLVRGQAQLQFYATMQFHNTNTWISFALYYGVGFLAICFWGLLRHCKRNMENGWMILFILILLSGEVIIYNPMLYAFVMYGFVKRHTLVEGTLYEGIPNQHMS